MGNKLPISALLQMSSYWDIISDEERIHFIEEGCAINEVLECNPHWHYQTDKVKEQIFLEAWSCYVQFRNLKWVPTN